MEDDSNPRLFKAECGGQELRYLKLRVENGNQVRFCIVGYERMTHVLEPLEVTNIWFRMIVYDITLVWFWLR